MGDLAVIQKCVSNVMSYEGHLVPPHSNVVFLKDQGNCKCSQQVDNKYSTICKLQEKSLEDHLGMNSDEHTVKIVLLQLAHALHHIHENGWVHGNIDLKNTYLSNGTVLLSHTTLICHNRNASRMDRAEDIVCLQNVFSDIRNTAKEIRGTDDPTAEDLLEIMRNAPRDALRKTIAQNLLNTLKRASTNTTTKDGIQKELHKIMGNIQGPSARKDIEDDLGKFKKLAPKNKRLVPKNEVVKNLFKMMNAAWEDFIHSNEHGFIPSHSDSTFLEIAQDLLGIVKGVTEKCKKSIADMFSKIVNHAKRHSFKKDIEKKVLEMTDKVLNQYKTNAVYELCEIISAPEGTQIILQHPYFWDTERRLSFLAKVAQFSKGGEIGKSTKDALDAKSEDIFGEAGWLVKLEIAEEEKEEYNDHYRKRKGNKRVCVGSDAIKNLTSPKSKKKTKDPKGMKNKGVANKQNGASTSRPNNDNQEYIMDSTVPESEENFMGPVKKKKNDAGVTKERDGTRMPSASASQCTNDNPKRTSDDKSENGGDVERKKKYDYDKLQSLLNFMRNKREHLWEESLEVQACFGYNFTDGYWKFFNRRFPKLFLVVYKIIKEHKPDSGIDIAYFQTITENKNLPVWSVEEDTETNSASGLQLSTPETIKHSHQDVVEIEEALE